MLPGLAQSLAEIGGGGTVILDHQDLARHGVCSSPPL
jgi:hypothetical protein